MSRLNAWTAEPSTLPVAVMPLLGFRAGTFHCGLG
jgi:hypothetical protein